jgi:aryl-alcohol dehydrogenase-like predicted oxidoreductase
MERRKLGTTGFDVAPLALGGNVFGWTADEPMSFRLLDAFVAAGFNLIDTADSYSRWVTGHKGGESETVLGRWIARRGRHDDVIIATKVGSEMGQGHKVLRKSYILQAVEASLSRLQVDCIDLYQSHWDDENTPFEEVLGAYEQLLRQGKVKAIGTSNLSAARLAEALEVSKSHRLPRYETLQPHYNLYERESFEGELQAFCVRENIGVITYFSLAAGFLTGKYRSESDFAKSARGPGMAKFLNPRGMKILDALDQVGRRYDATPAQIALAWLIARPGVTAPIASATNLDQLTEILRATEIKLDNEAMAILNRASE